MEKSRAIELLKLAVPIKALTQQEYADFVEAVNMGMDALEQPTFPDTIDRKAAIDRFNVIRPVDPKKDEYTKGIDVGIAMCIVAVKDQPTIQPEKVQLSKKSTTSDLISRTETVEHLRITLGATVPISDYDDGYVDGVQFAINTVSTMSTVQPQSTVGQLNDGAQSTDLIDRRAAIDALDFEIVHMTAYCDGKNVDNPLAQYNKGLEDGKKAIEALPSAQPDNHAVACLLAELFGDTCACNFNGIDEWLPDKCEYLDACPEPGGVTCWEQFLKHRAERRTDG